MFSWRGIYSEVAFTPSKTGSKEESLEMIEMALTEEFEGWKGGVFTYDLYTRVHFEKQMQDCFDDALYEVLLKDDIY